MRFLPYPSCLVSIAVELLFLSFAYGVDGSALYPSWFFHFCLRELFLFAFVVVTSILRMHNASPVKFVNKHLVIGLHFSEPMEC